MNVALFLQLFIDLPVARKESGMLWIKLRTIFVSASEHGSTSGYYSGE